MNRLQLPRSFEPEIRNLLSAALSTPGRLLEPEITAHFDWDRFTALAARHRIEGLVSFWLRASGAHRCPDDVLQHFDQRRRALALQYLQQAGETLRLSRLLAKAGIPVLVLKGCAVGRQLYAPNPELRASVDIDLLVRPSDFAEADRLLRRDGYARTTPSESLAPSADSMTRYLLNAYAYSHPETGAKVELHHRPLSDPNAMNLPFDRLLSLSVRLTPDDDVRSLGGEALAVYVCAHGAGHAFFRLKWLADAVRALDSLGPARLAQAVVLAREWGCERALLLALHLDEQLRGNPKPCLIQAQRRNLEPLVRHCAHAMMQDDRTDRRNLADLPADLREAAYAMRLASNPRSRLFILLRMLTNAHDAATLGLGARWAWLYALVGPALAAGRLISRYLPLRQQGAP